MIVYTREAVLHQVRHSGLDEFDVEDVECMVDLLLEAFTPLEVLSWLIFADPILEGTPVLLIQDGRLREVMQVARQMVSSRTTLEEALGS